MVYWCGLDFQGNIVKRIFFFFLIAKSLSDVWSLGVINEKTNGSRTFSAEEEYSLPLDVCCSWPTFSFVCCCLFCCLFVCFFIVMCLKTLLVPFHCVLIPASCLWNCMFSSVSLMPFFFHVLLSSLEVNVLTCYGCALAPRLCPSRWRGGLVYERHG